ncbi:hypothetical protein BIFGAL_02756 [Bifidobacterium gallicum DSM 20093 = LMG 11596]|uniref:Uncharacterized protein n=1 Tax=Bifidobacterium gallicum DSM 20093 = LMG 11596 TaxID=561180 RepID=D1NSJ9_9BIFI|nr:hypothetical protein BIFGAL_02756 [Bifidobacterium gallicum DSM 20093 = LMG 11596]
MPLPQHNTHHHELLRIALTERHGCVPACETRNRAADGQRSTTPLCGRTYDNGSDPWHMAWIRAIDQR